MAGRLLGSVTTVRYCAILVDIPNRFQNGRKAQWRWTFPHHMRDIEAGKRRGSIHAWRSTQSPNAVYGKKSRNQPTNLSEYGCLQGIMGSRRFFVFLRNCRLRSAREPAPTRQEGQHFKRAFAQRATRSRRIRTERKRDKRKNKGNLIEMARLSRVSGLVRADGCRSAFAALEECTRIVLVGPR